MKKKKIILLAGVAIGCLSIIPLVNLVIAPIIANSTETFTITLDENGINSLTNISSNGGLTTTRNGLIDVELENLSNKDGYWASLKENGYFTNTIPLSGLKTINATFDGTLILDYKFINQDGYYAKKDVTLISGQDYNFNYESPDVLNLRTTTGADIKNISIEYSCARKNVESDLKESEFTTFNDEFKYQQKTSYTYPTITEDDWNLNLRFTLSEDGTYYIVSDYLMEDRLLDNPTLIIPAYYKGLPVKEIAQAVEGIGAFSELTWLKDIYLPHTLERIGYGTFSLSWIENVYIDCASLEDFHGRNWVFYSPQSEYYEGFNVYFGPNVTRIPSRMFYPNVTEPTFMPKIKNIYFDDRCQIEEIGSHAFHDVTSYSEIHIPNSVKTIGEFAFYKSSITEIVLPEQLTRIDNDAFSFTKIKHVKINDKLTHIGDRAFSYSDIEEIDLSTTTLTTIEDEAFADITNLAKVHLPSSIKEIGQRGFSNSGLKEINIPSSVELIRSEAFYGNIALEKVYLGEGVKTILNKAFMNCVNLKELVIASEALNNFKSGNDIFTGVINNKLNIYVKDGVTSLPEYLFFSTSNVNKLINIATISLPTSLTNIGNHAFLGVDIDRVNYRGTLSQYNLINTNNNILNNVDFGGRSNG